MNEVTAVNTYDNSSGNIKALGFDSQDSLLQYVFDEVKSGNFSEKNVIYKGTVGELWSGTRLRWFYRSIFGSSSKVLFKDYVLEKPLSIKGIDKFSYTYSSLIHHLGSPKWLLIWRS